MVGPVPRRALEQKADEGCWLGAPMIADAPSRRWEHGVSHKSSTGVAWTENVFGVIRRSSPGTRVRRTPLLSQAWQRSKVLRKEEQNWEEVEFVIMYMILVGVAPILALYRLRCLSVVLD